MGSNYLECRKDSGTQCSYGTEYSCVASMEHPVVPGRIGAVIHLRVRPNSTQNLNVSMENV